MNFENAGKVLLSLKKHGPEHFSMGEWFWDNHNGYVMLEGAYCIDINNCGTTACLAGLAALEMVKEGVEYPDALDVCRWLEIDPGEDADDADLFRLHQWNNLGKIGQDARQIAFEKGEYEGAVYLLENLIAQGDKS